MIAVNRRIFGNMGPWPFVRSLDVPPPLRLVDRDVVVDPFEIVFVHDREQLRDEYAPLVRRVYFEKQRGFPIRWDGLDAYDWRPTTKHLLIRHRASNTFIGYARVVKAGQDLRLPLSLDLERCGIEMPPEIVSQLWTAVQVSHGFSLERMCGKGIRSSGPAVESLIAGVMHLVHELNAGLCLGLSDLPLLDFFLRWSVKLEVYTDEFRLLNGRQVSLVGAKTRSVLYDLSKDQHGITFKYFDLRSST